MHPFPGDGHICAIVLKLDYIIVLLQVPLVVWICQLLEPSSGARPHRHRWILSIRRGEEYDRMVGVELCFDHVLVD